MFSAGKLCVVLSKLRGCAGKLWVFRLGFCLRILLSNGVFFGTV